MKFGKDPLPTEYGNTRGGGHIMMGKSITAWTQNANWTYIRRSEDVQEDAQVSDQGTIGKCWLDETPFSYAICLVKVSDIQRHSQS